MKNRQQKQQSEVASSRAFTIWTAKLPGAPVIDVADLAPSNEYIEFELDSKYNILSDRIAEKVFGILWNNRFYPLMPILTGEMLLSVWAHEFYRSEAWLYADTGNCARSAIIHSLRKWTGALRAEEYGLRYYYHAIRIGNVKLFVFDEDTCSLCKHSSNSCVIDRVLCPLDKLNSCVIDCGLCPLDKLGFRCNIGSSPYSKSILNPEPMVKALETALYFNPPYDRAFTLWAAVYETSSCM